MVQVVVEVAKCSHKQKPEQPTSVHQATDMHVQFISKKIHWVHFIFKFHECFIAVQNIIREYMEIQL